MSSLSFQVRSGAIFTSRGGRHGNLSLSSITYRHEEKKGGRKGRGRFQDGKERSFLPSIAIAKVILPTEVRGKFIVKQNKAFMCDDPLPYPGGSPAASVPACPSDPGYWERTH